MLRLSEAMLTATASVCIYLMLGANSIRAAVPPPPRALAGVHSVLAKAPETTPGTHLRPLNIVLVANRKDHGPNEHDYPRWMQRWKTLLGGIDPKTTSPQAVNVYGPPVDLSVGPQPGAANVTV